MPDLSKLGRQITRRCKHCNKQLREVPVRSTVIKSPFATTQPAILCATCDAPGQLPKVPNA